MVTPEQNILLLLDEIEKRNKIIEADKVVIKKYESIVNTYKELVDKLDESINEKINIIESLVENNDGQYKTAKFLINKLKELQDTLNNISKINLN